ncbi:alpha/beta hydrolase [Georgenia sp. Z1344]|uniref:alpha/beta hydrolase n=1 Tax=Georgenia sp. Z1344 TaxID=3416706 RepID=UPI003CE8A33B
MTGDRVPTEVVDGVALYRSEPTVGEARAPVVFVHGGCHGGWQWEQTQTWFSSQAGRTSVALDWYSHGYSRRLSDEAWLARGLPEVAHEVGVAVDAFEQPPILVGHSMGGLASLAYAASHPDRVRALVLLTPVVPRSCAGEPIPLEIDATSLWGPPPPDEARELFFRDAPAETWEEIYARLQPESPTACWQATRWEADVDESLVSVPVLVLAGEQDMLTPADTVVGLARRLGADHLVLEGAGHGLTFDPRWPTWCRTIEDWLTGTLPTTTAASAAD